MLWRSATADAWKALKVVLKAALVVDFFVRDRHVRAPAAHGALCLLGAPPRGLLRDAPHQAPLPRHAHLRRLVALCCREAFIDGSISLLQLDPLAKRSAGIGSIAANAAGIVEA